jgi:hypothetical protein
VPSLRSASAVASLGSVIGLGAIASACGARTGLPAPDAGVELDASSALDAAELADVADSAPKQLACTPGSISLSKASPWVMFVLDRSGSMSTAVTTASGTRASRWQVLRDALGATLGSVDSTMAIGALIFPSTTAPRGDVSCDVASTPDLAPAIGHVPALLAALAATRPGGATPTDAALDAAASALLGIRAATTARAMVLATDGAPKCNAALDPATCRCASGTASCAGSRGGADMCLDDLRTERTISGYAARGLPTYVIGIHSSGDDTFSDVLDAMAVAGGRPLTSGAHRYYAASSDTELTAALTAIRDQVGHCTYLTTSVPDAAGTIQIRIDGAVVAPLPEGAMSGDGWYWSDRDNGQLVLSGAACTAAIFASVSALVTCGDGD